MRRALAILLVTVFSLPLIAPALASTPDDSQLPACCRRGGKHHCAMAMEMGIIPSRFHVVSEKCPYSPFVHSLLIQPHPLATGVRPDVVGAAHGPEAVIRAGRFLHIGATDHRRWRY